MFSLVVVDYNSINRTLEFINSFIESTSNNKFQIILVDNYIKDDESITRTVKNIKRWWIESESLSVNEFFYDNKDSLEMMSFLTGRFPIFQFRKNNIDLLYAVPLNNLGYAKGNNLGALLDRYFFHSKYLIISNNDIEFPQQVKIEEFEKIFKTNKDIAVIGPKVIGLDGEPQSPHKKISAFSQLILYHWVKGWPFKKKLDYDYTNESKVVYRVMGSFMLVDSDAFFRVGGFDPHTFLFAEEPILSEKLLKIGKRCYFFNDLTVVHAHGVSVKKNNSVIKAETMSFESNYYYFKNYRNTSKGLLVLSKVNFVIYKGFLRIKLAIKKLVH